MMSDAQLIIVLIGGAIIGLWHVFESRMIGQFRVSWIVSIAILTVAAAIFGVGLSGWLDFGGSLAAMSLGAACARIAFWTRWGARAHG